MQDVYEMILRTRKKQELERVMECNQKTMQYGLALSQEEVKELMDCRHNTLREQRRVEFGESILPQLIDAFCDSGYIDQNHYAETLEELQELFYTFKNESRDNLTDVELLEFMRQQFDGVCYGSLEYLGSTCLERFARAIRAGYIHKRRTDVRDEYGAGKTENEYGSFSEEMRWDRELYWQALCDLM